MPKTTPQNNQTVTKAIALTQQLWDQLAAAYPNHKPAQALRKHLPNSLQTPTQAATNPQNRENDQTLPTSPKQAVLNEEATALIVTKAAELGVDPSDLILKVLPRVRKQAEKHPSRDTSVLPPGSDRRDVTPLWKAPKQSKSRW